MDIPVNCKQIVANSIHALNGLFANTCTNTLLQQCQQIDDHFDAKFPFLSNP